MALTLEAPVKPQLRIEDLPVRGALSRRKLARRFALSAAVTVVLAYALVTILANPALKIPSIATYFASPLILQGLVLTVWISIAAFVIGLLLGVFVALGRMSENRLFRGITGVYVTIFRSVPLLVQILIAFNIALFFPKIGVGVPFTDIGVFADTNEVITPLLASLLALGLNQAAYTGEIIRGGLLSVPAGQKEAGYAMGMTPAKVFRRISLPQAIRTVIPPLGNDAINLVKATSLVSIVGVGDLMTRAQGIYANNYQVIPLLVVASIWYLILTAILTGGQTLLEKRFSRGIVPSRARVVKIREQGGS